MLQRLHGSLVMTIPRSDRFSTENGWKSVLLKNVNCVNLNHFRLKRLIPIEHDLGVMNSSRTANLAGSFAHAQYV